MSCVPFTGLAQFCRTPAARGKTWRGVARKELREEGRGERREERVRSLQLERVERPTPRERLCFKRSALRGAIY